MTEIEQLKEFLSNDDIIIERYTDGWNSIEKNFSEKEAIEMIKKSDDYRIVRVFNAWDLGS